MSIESSVNSFEKNVNTADKKLDTQNKVDEKKVVEKIKKVSSLFSSFEKNKLQKLKQELPADKYEKLEREFLGLKNNFEKDLENVNQILKKVDTLKFKSYRQIISTVTDKFYGLAEVSDKDKVQNTLWGMLVMYAGLDKDPNKQKGIKNWKKIAEWIKTHENIDPKKMHKGDVIMFPQEVSLFKNLNPYKDLINLEELFLHNKLEFKKKLTNEEKGKLYPILINFFNYRGDNQQSKKLFIDLMSICHKPKLPEIKIPDTKKIPNILNQKPSIVNTPKDIPMQKPVVEKGKAPEHENIKETYHKVGNNTNILATMLSAFTKNPDWHWYEFPQELGKGVMYGAIKAIKDIADLFDGETLKYIFDALKKLAESPMDLMSEIWDKIKDEFSNMDFSAPHSIGVIIGKVLANIVMTMMGVGIAGKMASTVGKIGKIKGLEKIAKIAEKGINKTGEFLHSALGGYKVKELTKFFKEDVYKINKLPAYFVESTKHLKNKDYVKLWDKNYPLVEAIYITPGGSLILDPIKFKKILPQSGKELEGLKYMKGVEEKGKYFLVNKTFLAGFVVRKMKGTGSKSSDFDIALLLYHMYKSIFKKG